MNFSPNIPKVIFRNNGNLLYQSRLHYPQQKKKNFIKAWRQVCIYSLRKSLMMFNQQKKKTTIENIENLELLRFLELGFEQKMIKM